MILFAGIFAYYYFDQVNSGLGLYHRRIRDFAVNLFLWELVSILSIVYLFLNLLSIHEKHKQETQVFLRIILQAVSHKFGNFLAGQKINLALFKEFRKEEDLENLEMSLGVMESDLSQVLRLIENFQAVSEAPEVVEISTLAAELLDEYSCIFGRRCVKFRASKVRIRFSCLKLRVILSILFENAFRYSARNVRCRVGVSGRKFYIFISNDLAPNPPGSTGLGFHIIKDLIRKNGPELKVRKKAGRYCVMLSWDRHLFRA